MAQHVRERLFGAKEAARNRLSEAHESLEEFLLKAYTSASPEQKAAIWEKFRKPLLVKYFQRQGFRNPEQATDIAKYLESRMRRNILKDKKKGWSAANTLRVPYFFQSHQTSAVRELVQGSDDPIADLEFFSAYMHLGEPKDLNDFIAYFSKYNANPRVRMFISKLQLVDQARPLSASDIQEGNADSQEIRISSGWVSTVDDPLVEVTEITEEQFNQQFNEDTLHHVNEFLAEMNTLAHQRLRKYRENLEDENADQSIFSVALVPDLVEIFQDSRKTAMYKSVISSMIRQSRDIYQASLSDAVATTTEGLCKEMRLTPELLDLFECGFVQYDLHLFDIEHSKRLTEEQKHEFQTVLQDKVLCRNAKLVSDAGFESPTLHAEKNANNDWHYHSEFYRDADTALLEKSIILWKKLFRPLNLRQSSMKDQESLWDLHKLWKQVQQLKWLESISADNLKNALEDLDLEASPAAHVSLDDLFVLCTSLPQLVHRLQMITNPQLVEIWGDLSDRWPQQPHPVYELIRQDRGWEVKLDLLDNFEDVQYLAEHKEDLQALFTKFRDHNIAPALTAPQLRHLLGLTEPEQRMLWSVLALDGTKQFESKMFNAAIELISFSPQDFIWFQSITSHLFDKSLLALPHDFVHKARMLPLSDKLLFKEIQQQFEKDIGAIFYEVVSLRLVMYCIEHPEFRKRFSLLAKHKKDDQYGGEKAIRWLFASSTEDEKTHTVDLIDEQGNMTMAALEMALKKSDGDYNNIVMFLKPNLIVRMPQPERDMYEFIHAYGRVAYDFVFQHQEHLDQYLQFGLPTEAMLIALFDEGKLKGKFLEDSALAVLDRDKQAFWKYFRTADSRVHQQLLLDHRATFADLIKDGQPTMEFIQLWAREQPQDFVLSATKEQWKASFGDQTIATFLASLPAETDERRNAFLHNDYDRTSQFLQYLLTQTQGEFVLDQQNIDIAAHYIEQYGFARTAELYRYFKYLYLFESGKQTELPSDIQESGIHTLAELHTREKKIRDIAYSETPLTTFDNLSAFERQILKVMTGKSTHRFDAGRPSFDTIVTDFQAAMSKGEIAALPAEYRPEILEMQKTVVEFNPTAIHDDFQVVKEEILEAIEHRSEVDQVRDDLVQTFKKKIDEIKELMQTADNKRGPYLAKELQQYVKYLEQVSSVDSIDDLVAIMVGMRIDKKLFKSAMRRLILRKVFQKHYSAAFIETLRMQLLSETISPASILSAVNVIDHLAKAHALNLKEKNKEEYWSEAAFAQLSSKRGEDVATVFSPYSLNLRKAVDDFHATQLAETQRIALIPDRGFIGEMSGYLADVCYTAEYPLLAPRPNLVPYKFVLGGEANPEFFGSVLIFEVDDASGNPCLLIRGFDVPNETQIDINQFIENFIDKMAEIGRARGKKRVLIPGNLGAISNYQMTLHHMTQYLRPEVKVSLREPFRFNNYILTNDCYVAREIS
jgi:hypothetical protein